MLRRGVFAALFALIFAGTAVARQSANNESTHDLVAAGSLLYSEGRIASGQPVKALVQGDVPVLGTQVACRSCHGRSGMGAIEGGRIPAAIAGPLLFSADAQRRRPAYTDSTLSRALREGIDSTGRPIDPLMPRYQLDARDLAALAAYLHQLGAVPSPGVTPDRLRIATIIAGDVASDAERAMLDVLETFVAARNRSGPQRLRGGHFPGQFKETYREWSLEVWRLGGPPETWRAQLDARYREHPPFALVGGLASHPWQPIHDFCEAEQMPCVLPDTDLPPADNGGVYSLYYSRGVRLEAEIIAATLAAEGRHANVVGVVEGRAGSASGEAAAALERALERRGGHMRVLDARPESGAEAALVRVLGEPTREEPASAIVLWLGAEGVRRLATQLGTQNQKVPPLYLSSTLLGAKWDDLPAAVQKRARVVHLTALPGEPDSALQRFRAWASARGLQIREERHQALAYFAILAFAEGTKHTSIFASRDYFMDLLEHASTLTPYLPLYRRAGMTPGQRVLSRGGYMVDLSGRHEPVWQVP